MQSKAKERWQTLCELAVKEQDPAKLLALIEEINAILDEKQNLLEAKLRERPDA